MPGNKKINFSINEEDNFIVRKVLEESIIGYIALIIFKGGFLCLKNIHMK